MSEPPSTPPVPFLPLTLIGLGVVGLAAFVGGMLLYAAGAVRSTLDPYRADVDRARGALQRTTGPESPPSRSPGG